MGRQRRAAWRDRGRRSARQEHPPGGPGVPQRRLSPQPDEEASAEQAPLEPTAQGHALEDGENHEPTLTQGRRDRKTSAGLPVVETGQVKRLGYTVGSPLVPSGEAQ